MARILITGVTGFTGRYLAPRLSEAGYEVHGTAHGDVGEPITGVKQLHAADIGNPEAIASVVSNVAPDKVVHLAAISFVAHSDVAEMYRINVLGTRNLLEALSRASTGPTAVLIASSANVYGNAREGSLDENFPRAPANDYGVTKAATELLAGMYRDKLQLIVARPFNYTGRGQPDHFLIPKIASHVRRRETHIELGNVDVARDFSDVRGVVDAYARLLEAPAAIGGTFNICSGRATPLKEVVEMISRISGHDLIVRVNPSFVRRDEVKTLSGSRERVEEVIGPLRMPPLEETLRWMLRKVTE